MNINLTTSPSAGDAKTISQGLIEYNRETIKDEASVEGTVNFSVFARDDESKVIGGLRATCFWNTLHIECMWLSREDRGQGTGSALIREAERFAIEGGYENAVLESASWQAKPFYEKLGYEVVATLPDYPKGHSMYILTKKLID